VDAQLARAEHEGAALAAVQQHAARDGRDEHGAAREAVDAQRAQRVEDHDDAVAQVQEPQVAALRVRGGAAPLRGKLGRRARGAARGGGGGRRRRDARVQRRDLRRGRDGEVAPRDENHLARPPLDRVLVLLQGGGAARLGGGGGGGSGRGLGGCGRGCCCCGCCGGGGGRSGRRRLGRRGGGRRVCLSLEGELLARQQARLGLVRGLEQRAQVLLRLAHVEGGQEERALVQQRLQRIRLGAPARVRRLDGGGLGRRLLRERGAARLAQRLGARREGRPEGLGRARHVRRARAARLLAHGLGARRALVARLQARALLRLELVHHRLARRGDRHRVVNGKGHCRGEKRLNDE